MVVPPHCHEGIQPGVVCNETSTTFFSSEHEFLSPMLEQGVLTMERAGMELMRSPPCVANCNMSQHHPRQVTWRPYFSSSSLCEGSTHCLMRKLTTSNLCGPVRM